MIILLSKQPERRIAIVSETHAIILKSVDPDSQKRGEGRNRPLVAIELVPKRDLSGKGFKKLSDNDIHGFIGLIEMEGLLFLGTITGKSKVAQPIPNETVNKIFAVDFFCLNDSSWDFMDIDSAGYPILPDSDSYDTARESLPRHPCFDIRKLLSSGSFYYSSDFDLTSTLQHRGVGEHSLSDDNFEKEYMWNSFLMHEIIDYRDRLDPAAKQILDDEGFLTTVICGFAETFITYLKKTKIAVTIISKQSWKRAGTRFNARGVDDDANVANFVETEFIMYSTHYCYAFTQIRGSVPVFWEQDTSLLNPKVQITRSMEATQPIFDKHFLRLNDKYGTVNVLNLLSTKSSEIELSQRYKKHLSSSKKFKFGEDVFLTEFDFHRETSQDGFAAVKRILPKIMNYMYDSGYFAYDMKQNKVLSKQTGVFRTNCLDCLDRTNLVQQTVSLFAFRTFLEDFQFITDKSYIDDEDFVTKHSSLWADHGDQISQIYTGTNALKSSFSRKGKMSLAGALSDATKSVSRMYINNFMDKGKQQNIDALLGRLAGQQAVQLYDPINEYVSSKLEAMSDNFTSFSSANVLVGTFNVNGTSRRADLSKWLFPIGDKFKPDIVVLGLQEVIELTAGSILNADYSKSTFWQKMVSDCLNQYDEKYLLLRVEQMSSLLILFFVKSDKANHIKQVEGASKKTGFGGMTGNKGAVAIRFDYGATSFCFVNAHFAAGAANIDERRSDYESILKGITFTRSTEIFHHESIFWLGDLNYRITLGNEEVRKELAAKREGYIEGLLKYDQLTQEINSGAIFRGFKEPTLKFRPTYKYDYGSDNYDTSEKARTPSWTDRIIYKGENLHPLAYSDASLTLSDHRPVYAAYRSKVTFVDEATKANLSNKLYSDYKMQHPEELYRSNAQLIDVENVSESRVQSSASLIEPELLVPTPSSSKLPVVSSPASSNSLSSQVSLKPVRKVTSPSQTVIMAQSPTPETKPKLRPPPPPISRSISSTPKSTETKPLPAVATRTLPPEPPKARKTLPPGFTEVVLKPRNTNNSITPVQTGNEDTTKKPCTTIAASPSPSTESLQASQESTGSESKKSPPTVPTKKPELEHMSLDAWKPLTPK